MTGPDPIVLASSPAVGLLTMQRLARALAGLGRTVLVPEAPFGVAAHVAAIAAAVPRPRSVLVGFSAAGPRLFAAAQGSAVTSIVFMDAGLPADGAAPDDDPVVAERLAGLPVDAEARLPAWPEWWSHETLARLCLDPALRAAFVAECDPIPRSMYAEPIPAPPYAGPCGYLAFGTTYATEAASAAARGWPVVTLAGHRHLAPLTAPAEVAAALVDLVDAL